MRKLLHTRNNLLAWLCLIGGLSVMLMLSTVVYFLALELFVDNAPKLLRIYGLMAWMYFWMYIYWRWVKRRTSWLQQLDGNEKKEDQTESF